MPSEVISNTWTRREGSPYPLGCTWVAAENVYNFALYSRFAISIDILFYTLEDAVNPCVHVRLDHLVNKTGYIWHCRVPFHHVANAKYYAFRIDGPYDPENGHRFDPSKIALDPYAKGVYFPPQFSRQAASVVGLPNAGKAPLGFLPATYEYDWSDDIKPKHHSHDLVIYEMHVRGFTQHSSSGLDDDTRGTFAGIIEKIPYLKALGITAVELLPIHQFDPEEANYWGYMTLNFFSPHHKYCRHPQAMEQMVEFKRMVKELHKADIEVILDVVYNHTTEGDETGPSYNHRLIDNYTYYILEENKRYYSNDAGTGNVLKAANSYVAQMIVDSLRFWVTEMHVDGFRFDLASIFTRNKDGSINLNDPPIISDIKSDPALANVRLIAEAWDITSYQLGQSFPGITWKQWNGKYRDDVRQWVAGSHGKVADLMTRIYGSADLFPDDRESSYHPYQSINFLTAHDGFCLYDLVSYNEKHNETNGHDNTDGANDNYSWNHGWEGDENLPANVKSMRKQQVKNFFAILMLSNGTPMFCAGDEFLNTQDGNNNPYNQDNEITWLNWNLLSQNNDIFRFFKYMIAFRKNHPSIARSRYWRDDVFWYGVNGAVDFDYFSRTLAFALKGHSENDTDLYVMINSHDEELDFKIGYKADFKWHRIIDTSLPSPGDIINEEESVAISSMYYKVKGRSVVAFVRKLR